MYPENGARILVVDPDPSVRALLVAILKRHGYVADAAASLDEALGFCRIAHHAAVIVEPRGLGGRAMLDALRDATACDPANLIVVTTSEPETSHYEECHGVRAVLRKPFMVDELARAVARCCEASH